MESVLLVQLVLKVLKVLLVLRVLKEILAQKVQVVTKVYLVGISKLLLELVLLYQIM